MSEFRLGKFAPPIENRARWGFQLKKSSTTAARAFASPDVTRVLEKIDSVAAKRANWETNDALAKDNGWAGADADGNWIPTKTDD